VDRRDVPSRVVALALANFVLPVFPTIANRASAEHWSAMLAVAS